MRLQQFQVATVEYARKKLPRALRQFNARSFFTIVKISYAHPRIHYEIGVRGKERLIEVGLHLEDEKTVNDAIREYLESCAFEIQAELGPRVEVEQWTNSWSRVHEVVPYTMLDAELVNNIGERLARMIAVLEPMLRQYEKKSKR
jgi:hypothetical protein